MFSKKPKSARAIFFDSWTLLPQVIMPELLLVFSLYLGVLVFLLSLPISIFKYVYIVFIIFFFPGAMLWLTCLIYKYIMQHKIYYKSTLVTAGKKFFKIIVPLASCFLLYLFVSYAVVWGANYLMVQWQIDENIANAILISLVLVFLGLHVFVYIFSIVYRLDMLLSEVSIVAALKTAWAVTMRKESIKRGICYVTLLSGLWMLGMLSGFLLVWVIKYVVIGIFMLTITAKAGVLLTYLVLLLFVAMFLILYPITELYFYNDLLLRYKSSKH